MLICRKHRNARANLINPQIRTSQIKATKEQYTQAQTDVLTAQADLDRAEAQLKEASAATVLLVPLVSGDQVFAIVLHLAMRLADTAPADANIPPA